MKNFSLIKIAKPRYWCWVHMGQEKQLHLQVTLHRIGLDPWWIGVIEE